MPEISIIVPVYNVEKYLQRCLDSIMHQTFSHFECILVDDGSTDNSGRLCDEYAEIDNRFIVVHSKNCGVSAARNTGLDLAKGKYIMFCDSDDCVSIDWCEEVYSTMEKYPDSLVVHNGWNTDPSGRDIGLIDPSGEKESNIRKISYYECFRLNLSGAVWNKVFVKDIVYRNGIRFDERRGLGEDVIFHTEYLKHVDRVVYINKPLYHYTINPEGAVRKYYPDLIEHHIVFFASRVPFIYEEDLCRFCDTYLYYFIVMLDNTLDSRNPMSFCEKMRYNHRMMNREEFRYCAAHATGEKDSKLFMRVVRTHNYYLYWAFQKIYGLKKRLLH